MSAAITPERIGSFWDEFVQHRDTDRGQWLTTNISWPYRTPGSGGGNRPPSIYDDERLRRAIIRFARSYMPDRATWESRLPRTDARATADAPAAPSPYSGSAPAASGSSRRRTRVNSDSAA